MRVCRQVSWTPYRLGRKVPCAITRCVHKTVPSFLLLGICHHLNFADLYHALPLSLSLSFFPNAMLKNRSQNCRSKHLCPADVSSFLRVIKKLHVRRNNYGLPQCTPRDSSIFRKRFFFIKCNQLHTGSETNEESEGS